MKRMIERKDAGKGSEKVRLHCYRLMNILHSREAYRFVFDTVTSQLQLLYTSVTECSVPFNCRD